MAMSNASADGEVVADLNTTPLIDVLLVLLVLLLITLPVQTHAVKLVMAGGHPLAPPPVVDLSVDFDGGIFWNGQKVSRATMDGLLASAAERSPQPEIHLMANRLAHYDTVAKVMADAQRLGMTNIGIVNTNAYVH